MASLVPPKPFGSLPYEALTQIREHIAEAAGAFRAPSSR